ncbi:putative membrane protein [Nocardiopsis arvandica]|uniref:Putative membrane protein n=1 Tax=Nocardiopsis sinuspersici TaxID=501010 RepID=A0A7Y9XGZ2_9ACTN|nr:DoxX family protein [Nocardiopsis sinuspersici]NYH55644.1 putative membrane protein [Nocardiopsis sinuspersici]
MAPLIALVGVTALLLALGAAGVRPLLSWPLALRGGLAAMFTLTGVSHFVGMREELVAMVPPALPAPGLLVTVTGVLELAGAAGLLWARTSPWAAAGLAALLVAMFPANVHAITAQVSTGLTDNLPVRTAMQAVFLAAALAVLVHRLRVGRRTPAAVARSTEPR